jgi:hypothetical protein
MLTSLNLNFYRYVDLTRNIDERDKLKVKSVVSMNKRQSATNAILSGIVFLALLAPFLFDVTSQFIQQALGQDTAPINATTTVINQTDRTLMPVVINITRNANATGTAADYIVNITTSALTNTSAMSDNKTGLEITPVLIDVLRNTNATSIAAEYIVNITTGANDTTRQ